MENELKTIIATNRVPGELIITYDDMHGLWGGTTITLRGDGNVERRTKEIGARDVTVTRTQIGQPEVVDLIRLLVELQAWEQRIADQQPVAGESRAHLTISLRENASRVWERVNEMLANNRLVQIKTRLENLSSASRHNASAQLPLYSPRQLPELEGDVLTLTWDQIDADSIISHEDKVIWRERTGWEVYDRFAEITEVLRQKYGKRLLDLVPTARSLYALYGDSTRASFHVASARQSLTEQTPETPVSQFYWLTLEEAVRQGDAETIRKYLARGGDPNTPSIVSGSTDTLLHVAARHRQTGIAQMLIAAGANVNATDAFERPPLHAALDTRYMPSAQPNGGSFRSPPEALLAARTTEFVKILVHAGAHLSGLNRPFNELHGLSREMYEPPLSVAAKYGYVDALRFLLAEGAEIEIEDYLSDTPMITAVRCGQPEAAQILIAAGADVNRMPYAPNEAQETQLLKVIRSERFSLEEKLVLIRCMVEAGADVNKPDATGDTPLIKAVRFGTDHYYALIGFGNEPNVEWRVTKWPVNHKFSPEEVAALVGALVEAGADIAARDRDGKTAGDIAADAALTEVATLLS
jgi:ankyrin repeat protein